MRKMEEDKFEFRSVFEHAGAKGKKKIVKD